MRKVKKVKAKKEVKIQAFSNPLKKKRERKIIVNFTSVYRMVDNVTVTDTDRWYMYNSFDIHFLFTWSERNRGVNSSFYPCRYPMCLTQLMVSE